MAFTIFMVCLIGTSFLMCLAGAVVDVIRSRAAQAGAVREANFSLLGGEALAPSSRSTGVAAGFGTHTVSLCR